MDSYATHPSFDLIVVFRKPSFATLNLTAVITLVAYLWVCRPLFELFDGRLCLCPVEVIPLETVRGEKVWGTGAGGNWRRNRTAYH